MKHQQGFSLTGTLVAMVIGFVVLQALTDTLSLGQKGANQLESKVEATLLMSTAAQHLLGSSQCLASLKFSGTEAPKLKVDGASQLQIDKEIGPRGADKVSQTAWAIGLPLTGIQSGSQVLLGQGMSLVGGRRVTELRLVPTAASAEPVSYRDPASGVATAGEIVLMQVAVAFAANNPRDALGPQEFKRALGLRVLQQSSSGEIVACGLGVDGLVIARNPASAPVAGTEPELLALAPGSVIGGAMVEEATSNYGHLFPSRASCKAWGEANCNNTNGVEGPHVGGKPGEVSVKCPAGTELQLISETRDIDRLSNGSYTEIQNRITYSNYNCWVPRK